MSHEITNANGRHEFAYTGQSPWHHLGQLIQGEAATKEEIMRAAGLDWTVFAEPIYLGDGSKVPGYIANVRSDTRETLGVVSDEYRIVQIGDAFSFVDQVARTAGAKYHTAGSIRRGRQIFASAKLPKSIVVLADDIVDQYLLLVNSYDASTGFHLRWTTIRVVCNNTLTAALRGSASYQYTVRHAGDLDSQLKEARKALGVADRYFEAAGQAYRALAAKDLSEMAVEQYLAKFLPLADVTLTESDDVQRERARVVEARNRIRAMFEDGMGTEIAGVKGTAWGLYNASTEWIDHVRTAKQDGEMRKGAAEAAVLGVGQDLRDRAMSAALALV